MGNENAKRPSKIDDGHSIKSVEEVEGERLKYTFKLLSRGMKLKLSEGDFENGLCSAIPDYGRKLFRSACHSSLNEEEFIKWGKDIIGLIGLPQQMEFYINLFGNQENGEIKLSQTDCRELCICCHTAAACVARMPTADIAQSSELNAVLKSMFGKEASLNSMDVIAWCGRHCKKLIEALHHYTISVLRGESLLGTRNSMASASAAAGVSTASTRVAKPSASVPSVSLASRSSYSINSRSGSPDADSRSVIPSIIPKPPSPSASNTPDSKSPRPSANTTSTRSSPDPKSQRLNAAHATRRSSSPDPMYLRASAANAGGRSSPDSRFQESSAYSASPRSSPDHRQRRPSAPNPSPRSSSPDQRSSRDQRSSSPNPRSRRPSAPNPSPRSSSPDPRPSNPSPRSRRPSAPNPSPKSFSPDLRPSNPNPRSSSPDPRSRRPSAPNPSPRSSSPDPRSQEPSAHSASPRSSPDPRSRRLSAPSAVSDKLGSLSVSSGWPSGGSATLSPSGSHARVASVSAPSAKVASTSAYSAKVASASAASSNTVCASAKDVASCSKLSGTILQPCLAWLLSCHLPSGYFPNVDLDIGGLAAFLSPLASVLHPTGWQLLFSSNVHGSGKSRFLHHIMHYKAPTVMLLGFEDHFYVLAADMEWKEDVKRWGGDDCMLIQILPTYRQMSAGANMLWFNLEDRTMPKGISIGKDKRTTIIEIDEELSSLQHYGVDFKLQDIEVWGCGGQKALEEQQKQQQWEQEQAEKAKGRKLKLEDWKDNPDKQLLGMGGVTTEHAER